MSEMVERAAEAAFDSLEGSYFAAQPGAVWPNSPYAADADVFRHAARAAIAALLDPTDAVLFAGNNAAGEVRADGCTRFPPVTVTRAVWVAMVEEALK